MDIHNIGSLRRLSKLETVDIAVLIFVYRGSRLETQKIGLMQSKRLYPLNRDVDYDDPLGFRYGLNALLFKEPGSPLAPMHRKFEFARECEYAALKSGDEQLNAVNRLNYTMGEVVYCLLRNPLFMPMEIVYYLQEYKKFSDIEFGARVYSSEDIESSLPKKKGLSPKLKDLEGVASTNFRLENWIYSLLRCKIGCLYSEEQFDIIESIIVRRSGSTGAALAINVVIP